MKVHQFLTFGSIFSKSKKHEEISGKSQMEKDFELINHEGLFEEYLEMGFNPLFNF